MSVTDITQKQKQELVKLLTSISKQCELEALGIVTREGITLAFFVQAGADPDLLSAISAAVMSTGTHVTSRMNHGPLQAMLIRGEEGFTILATAGDHILIGASKEIHSIGLTLNTIRDFAEPLEAILSS
ncbi:MAG: roadblock/LC7 domain-containing protein [Candidatus Heimdallarchaeota archaeon]|nr:roadblock/LC7 domain-containing protein [Candidatus Heimdallarchaeota archaeon]